ncbi:predicted protein [Histoplasma capsulatum H143]|uniref:Uncharacterized protein n=1 Tax=Ajellomyces capsulatus (strain H143) TaxID=544712 RepID=C6HFQ1_AJECH|nr:predicted protein [Histoplasma capsulatum H143]
MQSTAALQVGEANEGETDKRRQLYKYIYHTKDGTVPSAQKTPQSDQGVEDRGPQSIHSNISMADSFEKNSREVGRKALSGITTQTLSQPGRRLRAGGCMYSCECMRANGWHMEEEEEDDEAGRKSRAPIFQISKIGAEQPGYPRLLVG